MSMREAKKETLLPCVVTALVPRVARGPQSTASENMVLPPSPLDEIIIERHPGTDVEEHQGQYLISYTEIEKVQLLLKQFLSPYPVSGMQ